jgi:hypothetical protein
MELHVLSHRAALALLAFAGLLSTTLFSCEERIGIDTGASPPRLVVYGYITTDTVQHAIRITRSSGYFSTAKPEGISGAAVSIRHKEEVYPLTESGAEPGLYLTDAGVAGQEGETYSLHLSLDFDDDGQLEQYEAESFLPPAAELDSMAVQPSVLSDHHKEVLIWGRLPEQETNYFSFHFYRNGVLINDSLRGFSISSDELLGKKTIEGVSVFYLNQEREESTLHPGDSLTFRIEGITREYATFITNAQSEYRGSIPLFSAPPANIETNLRSLTPSSGIRVAGFFTAFSTNRVSMIYE